jgi:AcrR family transcriptional regulator
MRSAVAHGTRERILEAAEASFGALGYHGTRLHDIARRVGVQKASIFHHFASKQDLYRAVLAQDLGETEETVRRALGAEGGAIDKIRALAEAYVDLVVAHPARTKILLRRSLGDAPEGDEPRDSERVLGLVADFMAEGRRARALGCRDPLALVLGIVGMVAFLLISAPVLAPAGFDGDAGAAAVERVKRQVIEIVERCLAPEPEAAGAAASAGPPAEATGRRPSGGRWAAG